MLLGEIQLRPIGRNSTPSWVRAGGHKRRLGFEGLILDLDGTLVDSEPLHVRSTLEVLAAQGVRIRADALVPYVGWEERAIWLHLGERFGFVADPEALSADRSRVLARLMPRYPVNLLPGAAELLTWAFDRALPCAIASSLPRAQIDAILGQIGIGALVRTRLSGHDDVAPGRGKPAPDVYLAAASALSLNPSACVAIEDSAHGVESALAAGCIVLEVNPTPALRTEAGPRRSFSSLEEALVWLRGGMP